MTSQEPSGVFKALIWAAVIYAGAALIIAGTIINI
jgi:hypothetical protein